MASQVKVIQSDIKSQSLKTLLSNIVKHAYSLMINDDKYREQLKDKNTDLADIMKVDAFRKELTFLIYNQLIKGKMEHYVVLIGTDYMLQVKYRKGSMMKCNISGFTILLYEVPYIAVPTLPIQSQVTDEQYQAIKKDQESLIKIDVKQYFNEEDNMEPMKEYMQQALKETIVWYQQSEHKDERNDNLSGVMLSRFMNKRENYHWHIIFGDIVAEGSGSGSIITGHQVRLKRMNDMATPVTRIKLNFFMKMRVTFPFKNKKNGKETQRQIDVAVFNQQHNPQTSVESFFGGFKNFNPMAIFSANGMAVLAFMCILAVFFIQKRICYEDPNEKVADLRIPHDENILLDPSDEPSGGIVETICRAKNSFMTNLGVAFLLLTVIRQLVIRVNAKKDRVK